MSTAFKEEVFCLPSSDDNVPRGAATKQFRQLRFFQVGDMDFETWLKRNIVIIVFMGNKYLFMWEVRVDHEEEADGCKSFVNIIYEFLKLSGVWFGQWQSVSAEVNYGYPSFCRITHGLKSNGQGK